MKEIEVKQRIKRASIRFFIIVIALEIILSIITHKTFYIGNDVFGISISEIIIKKLLKVSLHPIIVEIVTILIKGFICYIIAKFIVKKYISTNITKQEISKIIKQLLITTILIVCIFSVLRFVQYNQRMNYIISHSTTEIQVAKRVWKVWLEKIQYDNYYFKYFIGKYSKYYEGYPEEMPLISSTEGISMPFMSSVAIIKDTKIVQQLKTETYIFFAVTEIVRMLTWIGIICLQKTTLKDKQNNRNI